MSVVVEKFAVDGQQTIRGLPFPHSLRCTSSITLQEAVEWAKENRDDIKKQLSEHGAMLLRGFPLPDGDAFYDFLMALSFEHGSYRGGGGPRLVVKGPIHTSTETPPEFEIPFHHELAYLTKTPSTLIFFCQIAPIDRGQTPLLDSNYLYETIKAERPEFIAKIEQKGVRYTRVLRDKSTCDFKYQRSWEDALETTDREEAEARVKLVGGETVEWLEDGSMKVISQVLPGIVSDPRTNLPTFFNSIVLLHPRIRGIKAEETLWAPCYGDWEKIDESDVICAYECMKKCGTKFNYQQGDVVLVDNYLALHSRTPFSGPRRILAAIAN